MAVRKRFIKCDTVINKAITKMNKQLYIPRGRCVLIKMHDEWLWKYKTAFYIDNKPVSGRGP